jgi:hypothetical protein
MTSPAGGDPASDPVEDYLDALADASRLRGRRLRHVLAEVEDHLATARAVHRDAGLDDQEAARQAVTGFGPAAEVAAGLDRAAAPSLEALFREGVRSLLLLGALGLLAIGLSGLLAAASGSAFGKAFVAGDGPGVTYTAERCAQYQQLSPAPSCSQAAVGHHYDEVVGYRLDAGALGLLVLGGWLAVVRPWRRRPRPAYDVLPDAFAPTVGAALFGAAAVVLLPAGLLELAFGGSTAGAGNPLSAGVVATVAFLGFAAALWRSLRTRPA